MRFRGRILDVNGAPIAGATITVEDEYGSPTERGQENVLCAVADGHGEFSMEGVAALSDAIKISARDCADLEFGARATKRILGQPGPHEFALSPARDVQVIVVDAGGEPIAGAFVKAVIAPGESLPFAEMMSTAKLASGRTGPDGALRLSGLPLRSLAMLAQVRLKDDSGCLRTWFGSANVAASDASGCVQLTIRLRRAAILTATLSRRQETEQIGFRLSAMRERSRHSEPGSNADFDLVGTTSNHPPFQVSASLLPGRYRVRGVFGATAKDPMPPHGVYAAYPATRVETIDIGERDIDLTLSADVCATVRGQVVDRSGAAVKDVDLRIYSSSAGPMRVLSARSGTDGRFEVDGLAPDSYWASVRSADYVLVEGSGRFDVARGQSTAGVVVRVERGGVLKISERSGPDSLSERPDVIILHGPEQADSHWSPRHWDAESRAWVVGPLRPGPFTIYVRREWGDLTGLGEVRQVDVESGVTHGVEFAGAEKQGAIVWGNVTSGGAPLDGVRVRLVVEGRTVSRTKTSSEGAFRMATGLLGEAKLVLGHPAEVRPVMRRLHLTPGAHPVPTIELPSGSISGKAIWQRAQVDGPHIAVRRVGRAAPVRCIGRNRRHFELQHLNDGRYEIFGMATDAEGQLVRVDWFEPMTVDVAFGGATYVGEITERPPPRRAAPRTLHKEER